MIDGSILKPITDTGEMGIHGCLACWIVDISWFDIERICSPGRDSNLHFPFFCNAEIPYCHLKMVVLTQCYFLGSFLSKVQLQRPTADSYLFWRSFLSALNFCRKNYPPVRHKLRQERAFHLKYLEVLLKSQPVVEAIIGLSLHLFRP